MEKNMKKSTHTHTDTQLNPVIILNNHNGKEYEKEYTHTHTHTHTQRIWKRVHTHTKNMKKSTHTHTHTHTQLNHLAQFSSAMQLCLDSLRLHGCSTPGFPVHHQLPEPTQTHVHRVGDAIQPSHPHLTEMGWESLGCIAEIHTTL